MSHSDAFRIGSLQLKENLVNNEDYQEFIRIGTLSLKEREKNPADLYVCEECAEWLAKHQDLGRYPYHENLVDDFGSCELCFDPVKVAKFQYYRTPKPARTIDASWGD